MGAGLLFCGLFFVSLPAVILNGCTDGGDKSAESESVSKGTPADTIAYEASSREPLGPPMPFPSVAVRSLDGETTDTAELVRGRYSIVIFLKIGCEACAEVLEVWEEVHDEFPPEMNVLAVTEESPVLAREYVEDSGFPFPLYCDEEGVFESRYGMSKYPSMVGVVPDGTVAYVGKPVTPEFTPQKAWGLLIRVIRARAEGTEEPGPDDTGGNEEDP